MNRLTKRFQCTCLLPFCFIDEIGNTNEVRERNMRLMQNLRLRDILQDSICRSHVSGGLQYTVNKTSMTRTPMARLPSFLSPKYFLPIAQESVNLKT